MKTKPGVGCVRKDGTPYPKVTAWPTDLVTRR